MRADDIRRWSDQCCDDARDNSSLLIARAIMETAAQLADLNANLRAIHPELNMPVECQQHQCSYYLDYLRFGPADMSHEAFHFVEKQATEHSRSCPVCIHGTRECPSATRYMKELRV